MTEFEHDSTADEMMGQVIGAASAFDFAAVTAADVERSLAREHKSWRDLGNLLSPAAEAYLEEMAQAAKGLTERHFGRNISLYTPIYIANHCVNECAYCGYNRANHIRRASLSFEEIEAEAEAIAATGLTDILLLTGESRGLSGVEYIGEAVKILARRFKSVGLEVYPLKTEEYGRLHKLGADFISVYQETYDPALYDAVHLAGPKKNYAWRFGANGRALAAGFRGAAFGALLGLGDFRRDTLACGLHAGLVSSRFPQAEISFSTPRIRPLPHTGKGLDGLVTIQKQEKIESRVGEAELTQVILALRLFMPWAGLSLSTRERAWYRDNLIGLGVTRLSAGVKTGVGGRAGEDKGDEQFQKSDPRDVAEIKLAIEAKGYQPVFNDHVRL
ncbi:2-iminoacetate synthase ThiH [Deltaproteobacteria bacterium OttesenSCG-928-K17]|nr:2-iminoacetate synthase ThiH [Deltaproteobacteria bacterium OttesenSCG-928-K17]